MYFSRRDGVVSPSLWAQIDAVIRVFDETGNVIKTHEHTADFKEW